jgi:predicted methyltransferase
MKLRLFRRFAFHLSLTRSHDLPLLPTFIVGVAIAIFTTATNAAIPTDISSAVADPSRPATDRERDADRKPAEVIAFAGLKRGDKVADFMPGRGYFTKIFCSVVGDLGHVYAISIPRATPSTASSTQVQPAAPDSCTNVTASVLRSRNFPAPELHSDSDDPGWVYEYYQPRLPAESFVAPEPLDMIWTSENYHDLHNPGFGSPNMQWVNTALLLALKPGGILIVEDHAAQSGAGARDTATLHRIDVEQVKKEVIDAGFLFVGESPLLRNADDPHTAKAHEMHDKTDRFLLKFRRP